MPRKSNGGKPKVLSPREFLDKFGRYMAVHFDGAPPVQFDLHEYLRVSDDTVSAQLDDQASLMGEFGQLLEHARDEANRAAAQVKVEYATLDASHREQIKDDGDKVTEAKVKNRVEADPAYVAKKANVSRLEGLVRRLERMMEALRERGRILVEKSRRQREIYTAPGAQARTSQTYPASRPPPFAPGS